MGWRSVRRTAAASAAIELQGELTDAAWAALAEIEAGDWLPRPVAAMDGWEPTAVDDGLRERHRRQATLPLLPPSAG